MRHLTKTKTAVPLCAVLAILLGSLSACADAYAAPARLRSRPLAQSNTGDPRSHSQCGERQLCTRESKMRQMRFAKPAVSSIPRESILPTRHCVEQSIARAVADVNAPALTSYYVLEDEAGRSRLPVSNRERLEGTER